MRERDSGRDIYPELTPLEFELIMLWDDYVDAYERAHKTRVNGLFEMLAGLAQARK